MASTSTDPYEIVQVIAAPPDVWVVSKVGDDLYAERAFFYGLVRSGAYTTVTPLVPTDGGPSGQISLAPASHDGSVQGVVFGSWSSDQAVGAYREGRADAEAEG